MREAIDMLASLYCLNQVLLTAALTTRGPKAGISAATASTVATIGNELDRKESHSPDTIAKYTGQLFFCIAESARDTHVAGCVHLINGGLYYVRTLECQQLKDVPLELMDICELFLAERFDELAEAIADYFDKRLALLASSTGLLR